MDQLLTDFTCKSGQLAGGATSVPLIEGVIALAQEGYGTPLLFVQITKYTWQEIVK